jgi:AcrR family transcriptional regulator
MERTNNLLAAGFQNGLSCAFGAVKLKRPKVKKQSAEISSSLGRRRLDASHRKQLILDEAIKYFTEVGFEASTRPLAARLGITQPLIFRYFPDKDDLIKAVYEETFLSRWRPEWEILLEDRTRPLRERLIAFYTEYLEFVFNPRSVRIFLFGGLRGLDLSQSHIRLSEERIHRRICREIRAEFKLPSERPISGRELELFWVFHGGIFYYGVRRYAYGVSVHLDLKSVIASSVDSLLMGMPAAILRAE